MRRGRHRLTPVPPVYIPPQAQGQGPPEQAKQQERQFSAPRSGPSILQSPPTHQGQQVPVQDLPVRDLPVQDLPVQDLPVQGLSVQGLPVQGLLVQGLPVQGLPVQGLPVCSTLQTRWRNHLLV